MNTNVCYRPYPQWKFPTTHLPINNILKYSHFVHTVFILDIGFLHMNSCFVRPGVAPATIIHMNVAAFLSYI